MKKCFSHVMISVLVFHICAGISEGATHLYVDLNGASPGLDSLYAPLQDSLFTTGFYVSNISNLYGYEFYVQFDTTRLKYISSSKGTAAAAHLMETGGASVTFQSNVSINQKNRILVGGYYLSQVPGAAGSGYLGLITFQKLTPDTTPVILAEPVFVAPDGAAITIDTLHNGLLLPPGTISIRSKKQVAANYNIQIIDRKIHCTLPVNSSSQIRLLDISGRSIYEKKNQSQQHIRVDLPAAGSGVFLLCISNSYESSVKKIILK